MRYAMIMAGGGGTRLWPLSRAARPKQFLPLIDGRSLLALAAGRLEGIVPPERRFVCTAERYRSAVAAAVSGIPAENVLGEPVPRDTVNAIGLTAAVLTQRDPGAVLAVLTADHLIEPLEELRRRFEVGFRLAEADERRLVTFSIAPAFPATSYGYVERGAPIEGFDGAYRTAHYHEKPDRATAERYLAAGTCGWSSGMFVFAARTFLEAMGRYLPQSRAALEKVAAAWGTPRRQAVLEDIYPGLQKISVDYAIMEPAAREGTFPVCTVVLAVSWMDVGSWPSYAMALPGGDGGNRATCRTLHLSSHNVLAVSEDPGHTIATIGCQDLVVVHTPDVTLVCPMSETERVKELVARAASELQ